MGRVWVSIIVVPILTLGAALPPDAGAETATDSDRALIAALTDYIPHVMRRHRVPGLNIALARRGGVIWEEGFGYSDWNRQSPMTPETVMHSGSMGKTYTGTAVMQLVERGVMEIDAPINDYLPGWRIVNPLGDREITLEDLLTHRSGLTGNAAGSDFSPPKPLGEHLREGYGQSHFKSYRGTVIPRWSAKVGERFQYSNFGLATLGYLVEVTNPGVLSFSDYVQRHIIEPLGMTSTQYPPVQDAKHVRKDIFDRFSRGYAQYGPVHLPTMAIYFADFPAGTVVTTPGDHIRLLLAYLGGGALDGRRILERATVDDMLTPRLEMGGSDSLGLIWMLRNVGEPDMSFGHGGAHMYGWMNDFRAFPDQDFAISVAANHWPMMHERYREHRAIAGFVSRWIARERDLGHPPPFRSWAWKTSYVIGLNLVEQLAGSLGIASPVTDEMLDAMIAGVQLEYEDRYGDSVWDEDGFRAGVEAMQSVEMTPAGIKAFLESDRIEVTRDELALIHEELGGVGTPFQITALAGDPD
jgi:CubicO group peptidase (beta-lactamase class C family)